MSKLSDQEWFHFGRDAYDVALARRLIQSGQVKPRADKMPVAEYCKALGLGVKRDIPLDKHTSVPLFVKIDWKHAAAIDPNRLKEPGIVAETKHGGLLIDGNHRLVRLNHDGVTTMDVLVFPKRLLPMITQGTAANTKARQAMKKYTAEAMWATHGNVGFIGDVQGVSRIGNVHMDQRDGLGGVPDNTNVVYLGVAVVMTPARFLALAAPKGRADTLSFIRDKIDQGTPIASPFLIVDFTKKYPLVQGHEGRTRMMAVSELFGPNTPVLVHIFPRHMRARHLTENVLGAARQNMVAERQKTPKRGPHFSTEVCLNNAWVKVDESETVATVERRVLAYMARAGIDRDIVDTMVDQDDALCDLRATKVLETMEAMALRLDSTS